MPRTPPVPLAFTELTPRPAWLPDPAGPTGPGPDRAVRLTDGRVFALRELRGPAPTPGGPLHVWYSARRVEPTTGETIALEDPAGLVPPRAVEVEPRDAAVYGHEATAEGLAKLGVRMLQETAERLDQYERPLRLWLRLPPERPAAPAAPGPSGSSGSGSGIAPPAPVL